MTEFLNYSILGIMEVKTYLWIVLATFAILSSVANYSSIKEATPSKLLLEALVWPFLIIDMISYVIFGKKTESRVRIR